MQGTSRENNPQLPETPAHRIVIIRLRATHHAVRIHVARDMTQLPGVGAKLVRRQQRPPMIAGLFIHYGQDRVAGPPQLRREVIIRVDCLSLYLQSGLRRWRMQFAKQNIKADGLRAFGRQLSYQTTVELTRPGPTELEIVVDSLQAVVIDENDAEIGRHLRG